MKKRIIDLTEEEASKICKKARECKNCPLALEKYCIYMEIIKKEVTIDDD